MAGKFDIVGENVTITFSYTTLLTTAQPIIENCAHWLWNHGKGDHGTANKPIEFEDLSAQQQLNLVDDYVRETIVNLSHTYKTREAQRIAREAEEKSKLEF